MKKILFLFIIDFFVFIFDSRCFINCWIETKKFNNLISNKINKSNNNVKINLKQYQIQDRYK